MTHEFDAKKTQEFFDKQAVTFSNAAAPRDRIFLELILSRSEGFYKKITALDFGCGGGALLLNMLKLGIDAVGIEKHSHICQLARQRLAEAGFGQEKIVQGGVEELAKLPKESFDYIVVMGVFQYLSGEDYDKLLKSIFKLLKRSGHLVATFQNALFDMFTFNKYTVDFFQEKFFKPLGLDKLLGDEVNEDIKGLITNYNKPGYSAAIARDNIYVRTSNPLTIDGELQSYGFSCIQKYFYSFYLLPRAIEGKYKDKLQKLQEAFEVKKSAEWYGHFMANAFLVDCIKK